MKKGLLLLLVVLLCMAIAFPVLAAINVTVDGKQLTFDVPPTSINGRTMVPLRAIFEALGATVNYEPATRTITATKGSTLMKLQVDNPVATVNGAGKTLDVPPTVIDGRTLVPTRFIAENLGATVEWVGSTSTVVIKSASAANPAMAFELTSGEYQGNNFVATGVFRNTGNVKITKVDYVSIKLFMSNNAGDTVEAANQSFIDIPVNLAPGQADVYSFTFTNVPQYADATSWDSDEYDWQFEYEDSSPAPATTPTTTPTTTTPTTPASTVTANPAMTFELTEGEYQGSNFVANGTFKNTGNVKITKVNTVKIKLFMYNNAGDSVQVAEQSFANIPVNLAPGQSDTYTFTFVNVPQYSDATAWGSDEYDWEFEYE